MYPTPEHSEARVFPVSGRLSDARLSAFRAVNLGLGVPKPQSEQAMTFSRPTSFAYRIPIA
jgi:hypothetical protein